MRHATLVLIAAIWLGGFGCNDLRQFEGPWRGPRVGEAAELRVGVAGAATATLDVDQLDLQGLRGTLTVDGVVAGAAFASVPGAEADVLAGMTFAGAPLRVYLGFVATSDGGGPALAVISLHDERRVEIRLLRGGDRPLYAIFALTEA